MMNDIPRFQYDRGIPVPSTFKEVNKESVFSCHLPHVRDKNMFYLIETYYQDNQGTPAYFDRLVEYRQYAFDYIAYNIASDVLRIHNKYSNSRHFEEEIAIIEKKLNEIESDERIRDILAEMPDTSINFHRITLDGISVDMKNWFLYYSNFFDVLSSASDYFQYFSRGYERVKIIPILYDKKALEAVFICEICPRILVEYFESRGLTFKSKGNAFYEDRNLQEWIGYCITDYEYRNANRFIEICTHMTPKQQNALEKHKRILWNQINEYCANRRFTQGCRPYNI